MVMKKLFLLLLVFCAVQVVAQDLNTAQRRLRSDITQFLREEGFMPEIDSDGDIKFKKEGGTYYISIDYKDDSPMYLVMYRQYLYSESGLFVKRNILKASNELNFYKGVKILCFESNYSFRAEMYLVNAEHFKYTFYKLLSQLASIEDDLETECQKVSDL